MIQRARLASLLAIGLAVAAATCSDEPKGDDDDAGGTGATGPGVLCQPGATEACYEGPAGSEGVGACRAGARTCAADGASFGPCEGQALPAAEVCGDAVDEDCDGAAAACPQPATWAKRYGDGGFIDASLVVDSADEVILAGRFDGAIDLGGGPLETASGADIFVARLDGEGNHLWSRSFGSAPQDQAAHGVAVGPSGSVGLAGEASGPIDFGGGDLPGDSYDIVVAKLDADGAHLWSKRFPSVGGEATARGQAVAIDGEENLILLGTFKGQIDVGGGVMTANDNVNDYQVVLARYDPAGNHLWSQSLGDGGWQEGTAVAVGADGDIYLAGEVRGSIDLGGGPLTAGEYGGMYVGRLDGAGAHVWSRYFDGAQPEHATVDAAGDMLVAGYFYGSVDFAGNPFQRKADYHPFVVKLDGATGAPVWGNIYVGDSIGNIASVAVDPAGDVLITGSLDAPVDLGGSVVDEGFVAKLDGAGSHVWSRGFLEYGMSVGASSAGEAFLLGIFSETVDLGSGPLTAVGDENMFLARFPGAPQ